MPTRNVIIEHFIEGYLQKQDYYRRAAELCHEHCHEVLSQNGIRHIATFRAKGLERLREKLCNRAATHVYETEDDISRDIVDLAGARVALYFPAELADAVRVLRAHFEALQSRTFPKESGRRGDNIYQYRFPGYSATHLLVKLKPDTLRQDQRHYAEAIVEIQIASVLMHAWAEVEHDLVYKPLTGQSSIGEYSLLDQINGLALTGDVTLEQLQRTMKERIAREERRFENHYDLASHIHNAYVPNPTSSGPLMGRVDRLLVFLKKLRLDAPGLLQPFMATLPRSPNDHRPLADQLREHIIQSPPDKAQERQQIWAEVERLSGMMNAGTDEIEDIRANLERQIKKRWATFEALAKHVLTARDKKDTRRTLRTWITTDTLRELGFATPDIDTLTDAQKAYVRVLSDQWVGTTDDLSHYADALQVCIQRLYSQFPELLTTERGAE